MVTMYVSHLMGRMDESVVKAAGIIFSLAGIAGIIAAPFWGKRGQQLGYTKVLCFVYFVPALSICVRFLCRISGSLQGSSSYTVYSGRSCTNVNARLVEVRSVNAR
ncbi:MAG: hypothetical protein ACLRXQ_02860 [Phascolarctobacterium faecium]